MDIRRAFFERTTSMSRHQNTNRKLSLAGKVMRIVLYLCLFCMLLSGCGISIERTVGGEAFNNSSNSPGVTSKSELRVIFLDVGQGASQLIISPSGKTMLIDAGNNSQEQAMIQYLHKYGVKRLDIVIGTHPDADHIGGLDRVIRDMDIGEIYMPKVASNTQTFKSVLEAIRSKGLKVKTAKAGLDLNFDDKVEVRMLAPVKPAEDNNNMSAVVKVTYGSTSYLLTGDAERDSEKGMIASGANLQADVLLVGHHGSTSSTSERFLNAVNPKYAVIQVGENSYGHPTKLILDRLAKHHTKIYRNDRQGTIEITSDGEKYKITTER